MSWKGHRNLVVFSTSGIGCAFPLHPGVARALHARRISGGVAAADRSPGGRSHGPLKDHLIASIRHMYGCGRGQLLAELARRLFAPGFPDCAACFRLLTAEDAAGAGPEAITAQLTVADNCFFRDPTEFSAFHDFVPPEIMKRNKPRAGAAAI